MQSLPSYQELKQRFPLHPTQRRFVEESRQTIRNILNGTDPRLLLIIGPCSIHDPQLAKDYALHLQKLAKEVSSHVFLVMRVYCEKQRTSLGWPGFVYDPLLDGSHAMYLGVTWARELLLELASLEVPAATEFVDPLTALYYDDLISWGSIGARSASSQIHRNLASALPIPIGFKNGIAGNISAAITGAFSAAHSHPFLHVSETGQPVLSNTKGNPDTHVVLRGGESGPNYDADSVLEAVNHLKQAKLPSRLLIDCSHHNSGKKHDRQPIVFRSVIDQICEGNTYIRGVMLESHLHEGKQPIKHPPSLLQYGVSITDSCLDWPSTVELIHWSIEHLQQQQPCLAMQANQ